MPSPRHPRHFIDGLLAVSLPNRVRSTPPGSRRGLTLLELVLVMTIFAVVVGGGVGFFANLDLAKGQAAGLVRNVLRSARQTALTRRAPARVRFDRVENTLQLEAMQVVGTWHFESQRLLGAMGMDGYQEGARFDEQGWIGAALAFDGQPGAHASFPVHRDPAYDPRDGFRIECAVRRDAGAGGRLLGLGDAIEVLVNGRGAVRARFRSAASASALTGGEIGAGGSVLVESDEGAIPVDRWTRLSVSYDRSSFIIAVDGIPVAETPAVVPVVAIESELVLSHPDHPFPGAIDALVISMVEAVDPVVLPESVRLPEDTPNVVHFEAGGGLDRRHHAGPLVVPLEFPGEERAPRVEIAVGLFGTVE